MGGVSETRVLKTPAETSGMFSFATLQPGHRRPYLFVLSLLVAFALAFSHP